MANITKWFGYPIYITSIKNFKEINKDIIPIISKNITATNSQYSRTTDIKPKQLQSIDDNLHLDKRFHELFKEIENGIRGALLMQNYEMDLLEAYITKSWATFSTKDQFISYHRHMSSHYSFVYYPQAEDQGNLFFLDDEAHKVGLNVPKREPYFNKWDNNNFAKAEYPAATGNLVIFPSMIFHETGKNTKDKPRISISGDVMLTMREGIKSEHNIPSPSTWKKL
jgi:uncharacterized protein (TIGR02466 family)|tara:strand:+ start:105 stop:779 length:675 start_codon:yes stop_codon:yes gene_type:complete